jgi:hypothetical protein
MSSMKKQKPVSIRQQVSIKKAQNCAEFSAHRCTFSLRNYEKQPTPKWFSFGIVC